MEFIYHVCEWDELVTCPVMSQDGKASCALFSEKENPKVVYLANLYVDPSRRKEGCGKELLRLCEGLAHDMGYESISLKVEIIAWMRKWYEREGFEFAEMDEEDPISYVWLRKAIA